MLADVNYNYFGQRYSIGDGDGDVRGFGDGSGKGFGDGASCKKYISDGGGSGCGNAGGAGDGRSKDRDYGRL